ncbi:MAG: cell envelope integrity EipB family protein [Rhodospirillaceae bacterium]|nr:cell envelope integrity EipB family protein [Rhodospirillaceae bacterium]
MTPIRLHVNRLPIVSATAFLAPVTAIAIVHAAAAAEIAPHRAIYDVELSQLRSGTSVSDVDGQMMFQWSDSCDAWVVEQRYNLDFLYQEGQGVHVSTSYATWESKDGLSFTFNLRRLANGVVEEELRGKANLEGTGAEGLASFRLPDDLSVGLPAGTLFPTAHTIELIDRAAAGEWFFVATFFDGSEAEGVTELSAVIGDRRDADPDAAEPLLAGPSWPVQMAFFSASGDGATPEYEIAARLYANGVIDHILIDYGDFVMEAQLSEIESLPASGC